MSILNCDNISLSYGTKEIIKKWDSMTEMYNKDGYAITLVGKCCKNILNSAYGYGWRYADNF